MSTYEECVFFTLHWSLWKDHLRTPMLLSDLSSRASLLLESETLIFIFLKFSLTQSLSSPELSKQLLMFLSSIIFFFSPMGKNRIPGLLTYSWRYSLGSIKAPRCSVSVVGIKNFYFTKMNRKSSNTQRWFLFSCFAVFPYSKYTFPHHLVYISLLSLGSGPSPWYGLKLYYRLEI